MTDDRHTPPAPKLPDAYETQRQIQETLDAMPLPNTFGAVNRTKLDTQLAVVVVPS